MNIYIYIYIYIYILSRLDIIFIVLCVGGSKGTAVLKLTKYPSR